MKIRQSRDASVIERMTADLVRHDAASCASDAIRCLMSRQRYDNVDVTLFVDEARRAALALHAAARKAAA
jgi:hypothetical protein